MRLWDEILDYAKAEWNAEPEYLWESSPDTAVLRHTSGKKWFALLTKIPASKLGLPENVSVDIMNVKLDPLMIDGLRGLPGFYPAWHMNKKSWMTILLDGTVSKEEVLNLLRTSFSVTDAKKKKGVLSNCHNWLIPANPKYYDVESAFLQEKVIRWKQSTNISVGDTIYMYVGAPTSALRFRCRAVEVNLPYTFRRSGKQGNSMMIELLETYPGDYMPRNVLWEDYGVYSVRGPRSVPPALLAELKARAGEMEEKK